MLAGVDYYVRCWGFLPNEDYGEIPVPADLGAVLHIGVGAWHACAVVASTRAVRCWMYFNEYEMGQFDAACPGCTAVPTDLGAASKVYAGLGSHSCAIKASTSTLVCWGGDNQYGERDVPPELGAVQAAAVGLHHTCAIQATPGGRVVCWGQNDNHQAQPPAGLLAVSITAAADRSCAASTSGNLVCWGSSLYYVLNYSPPAGLGYIYEASAGEESTCAVNKTNHAVCWTGDYMSDTQVEPGMWSMSAGAYYACGLKTNGTVVCIGSVYDGETARVPANLGRVVLVLSSKHQTCAMTPNPPGVCVSLHTSGSFLGVYCMPACTYAATGRKRASCII